MPRRLGGEPRPRPLGNSTSLPALPSAGGQGQCPVSPVRLEKNLDSRLPPVWNQPARAVPGHHRFQIGDRPSTVARRVNFEQDRFTEQLNCGARQPAEARQTMFINVQELPDFNPLGAEECFRDVTALLDDVLKGLRNGPPQPVSPEKLQEEAAKRKAEERKRQVARKKEQEIKSLDPKTKVQLKLENLRNPHRFGELDESMPIGKSEAAVQKMVPMKSVSIGGGTGGHESYQLVDVKMLQAKSLGLNENPSVPQMLDLMKQKEKQLELERSAAAARACMASAEVAVPSAPEHTHASRVRRSICVIQRSTKEFSSAGQNAGMSPDDIQQALAQLQESFTLSEATRRSSVCLGGRRSSVGLASRSSVFATGAKGGVGSRASLLVVPGGAKGPLARKDSKGHVTVGRRGDGPRGSSTVRVTSSRGGLSTASSPKAVAEEVLRRKHIHACWAALRAFARWLSVLREVRGKARAALVCAGFLKSIVEWREIANSMRKSLGSIRTLQLKCREHLQLKAQRLEILKQEWNRVEDKHLQRFFKMYVKQILKEQIDEPKEDTSGKGRPHYSKGHSSSPTHGKEDKKKDLYKGMMESIQAGEMSADWRPFKIPGKVRMAVLSRYYIASLKKRVRLEATFINTTKTVMRCQKETRIFLDAWGAKPSEQKVTTKAADIELLVDAPSKFWLMTEETLLQLIGLAAQWLSQEAPFNEHPAFKEMHGNTMYCPPTKGQGLQPRLAGGHPTLGLEKVITRLVLGNTEASVQFSKRASKQTEEGGKDSKAAKVKRKRNTLEDVFQSFSMEASREDSLEKSSDSSLNTQLNWAHTSS